MKGIEIQLALNSKSKHIFAKKSSTNTEFKVYLKEGMTNIDYVYQKQRSYALLRPKSWDVLVLKNMLNEEWMWHVSTFHMECMHTIKRISKISN